MQIQLPVKTVKYSIGNLIQFNVVGPSYADALNHFY